MRTGIRYIFSANAGRSGSEYLSQLLACAEGVSSVHEGVPICCGAPMLAFNDGDELPMRRLMPRKMRSIQASRPTHSVYAESSHTFAKGFGLLLPDNYMSQEEMGVVVLSRGVEETATSFLRLHEVPGLRHANNWWLKPGAKRNILPPPPGDAHPFEFCKWYVREMQARAVQYQRLFPRITYCTTTVKELNTMEGVMRLFSVFGLRPTSDLRQVVGQRTNVRDEFPRLSLEELTEPCDLPSADLLAPADKDALLKEIVAYVHRREGLALRSIRPGGANDGVLPSLAREVFQLYSKNLKEMQQELGVRIMFTDMVHTAGREVLYSVHSSDLYSRRVAVKVPRR
eukprot:TRINITY_DN10557_c0_g2_i1.p1 TRINITY_DN10557_c0_g2~~TRINITY_DN10557_c0_g2_i1.p1  ORF type:complete len:342 (+),score=79.61 TRINITY_DN10557_c0_g2_i1:127-1152(+)